MNLVLIGASVRAAAHSALRAGLDPIAFDLFADRDLAAIATTRRIPPAGYPASLADLARHAPPGPWMFTGGLENEPDLVDRLARERPLWGISGASLRAVRDPVPLAETLRRDGIAAPRARTDPGGTPRDGSWLLKPFASAGGLGIVPYLGQAPIGPSHYLQERIDGLPASALFLGRSGTADLLGMTEQLLGAPGSPFAYRGSLGPLDPGPSALGSVAAIGHALARRFDLRGLFGVDLVLRDGTPWVIEVNPRYTASVEVLELALGRPFLAWHRAVFEGREPPATQSPTAAGEQDYVGKAVLFADRPGVFPAGVEPPPAAQIRAGTAAVADIPAAGTAFTRGEPVLTVLARAASPELCRTALEESLERWSRRLHAPQTPGPFGT